MKTIDRAPQDAVAEERLPQAEFRLAFIHDLTAVAQAHGQAPEILCGKAVSLSVSAQVIAASRRDGGLWHRFGVFQVENARLGVLLMHADGELHVVLLDLAAPASRAFLDEGKQQLKVAMFDPNGDTRVMVAPASNDIQMWVDAAREAGDVGGPEKAEAVTVAAQCLLSEDALQTCGLRPRSVKAAVIHVVMTDFGLEELARVVQRSTMN